METSTTQLSDKIFQWENMRYSEGIKTEDVKEFIRELKEAWNDPTRLESMDDWINNQAGDKLI